MSAAALDQLRQGGFTLSLVPGSADRLLIKPLSKVTSEVRELIGSNRAAIVASLTAEAANDGHLTELPPPIDHLLSDGIPTSPEGQGLDEPDEPGLSRADRFRRLNERYFSHAMECSQCCAAGRGYGHRCDVGQPLWAATQSAPVPWAK
jgi:hypothetical protein